ncbi:MAG: hypothetical protein ACI9LY_001613, partial [Arenicella sp.]
YAMPPVLKMVSGLGELNSACGPMPKAELPPFWIVYSHEAF